MLFRKMHICSALVMEIYDTAFNGADDRNPLDTRHGTLLGPIFAPAYFYDHGALVDVTP
jgi:hypothetical protein